jgi:hypothetical protein
MEETHLEIQTADAEDLACAVCGEEPIEEERLPCRDCGTLHHEDCWGYNKGCARYACAAGPGWRPSAAPGPQVPVTPEGKVLLSHLAFGSYDGVYYAPWLASALTIAFELVALLGPAWGQTWLFGAGLVGMLTCILWIALSAERFYLDLEERVISKAKAVVGRDILEWSVLPLARVARLALIPQGEDRFLLAAVGREDEILPMAPPMRAGSPAFHAARDLLARLRANNVFPVEIPTSARLGASREVLESLDTPLLGEAS